MTNREKSIEILNQNNVSFEVLEHSKKVYTCDATAVERKVPLNQVVKTLICYDKKKRIHIFMIPGSESLDQKKARKLIGSNKMKFVPSNVLETEFGLIIGAISALLLIGKGNMLMDSKLADSEFVTISTGEPGSGLKLRTPDFKKLIECNIGEITKIQSE